MPSSKIDGSSLYDVVGLGFGPANLAVAGAIIERLNADPLSSFPVRKSLFIEKHDRFRWHPGMLLPGARMQISFMKDLATLRNPQSPITFLAYLHSQNRLVPFINRGSTIPTRKEYADYLEWAAQYVQNHGVDVLYGHEIIALSQGRGNSTINVRFRDVITGAERVIRTRDVIIAPGGSPRIPETLSPISEHPYVIHSSTYALSIGPILESLQASRDRSLRIAVIGSGQSAAEVTLDIRDRLSSLPSEKLHEIDMIIRKGSLKPSDDSPFANEIFDPSSTDTWFNFPSEQIRASSLKEYKSTNYGVVNPGTLETLHEVIYDQKLDDGIARRRNSISSMEPRINIQAYSSILSTNTCPSALSSANNNVPTHNAEKPIFSVITQNAVSGAISEVKYDVVICATGYQRTSWIDLLRNSDLGRTFGLHSGSCTVQLAPVTRRPSRNITTNMTELSTPTLPSMDDDHLPNLVFISRHYRLLPSKFGQPDLEAISSLKPRVYLQGVEETTHGLSDTLLSVLGARAGEVVSDLCSGRIEKSSAWVAESKL